jgi:3-hydroxyacyl-[acyl-carrier-protein] dehydratase
MDLGRVAVSAERVAALNPQSGDMRQLDHVVWHNDALTCGLGVKQVRDDEFWVAGHIPGRPLLPGVLMIEAGAQLASVLYRLRTGERRFIAFTRCDDAAFRCQVAPGDTLLLLAREVSFKSRRFICDTQGMVDGRIAFEARVTGMVVEDPASISPSR